MGDDENVNRAFGRYELQAELFLQCGEDVGVVRIGGES